MVSPCIVINHVIVLTNKNLKNIINLQTVGVIFDRKSSRVILYILSTKDLSGLFKQINIIELNIISHEKIDDQKTNI